MNIDRTTRGGGGYPGAPRWVKVLGIIAAATVLLVVVLMLTRGPDGHGPRRHGPPAGAAQDDAAPSGGETPAAPERGH